MTARKRASTRKDEEKAEKLLEAAERKGFAEAAGALEALLRLLDARGDIGRLERKAREIERTLRVSPPGTVHAWAAAKGSELDRRIAALELRLAALEAKGGA